MSLSPIGRGLADCVRGALCSAALEAPIVLDSTLQHRVEAFVAAPWPGDAAVRDWLLVPEHLRACSVLDYRAFGPEAMLGGSLPVFAILEAFSHTDPDRFARVWVPIVEAAQLAVTQVDLDQQYGPGLREARNHLQRQLQTPSTSPADTTTHLPQPPLPHQQIDTMLQRLLQNFPGLEGIIQQMMAASPNSPADGLGPLLGQIQDLLSPLLSQAASSAGQQDPWLQPALNQILGGFAALTGTLTAQQQELAAAADQPPAAGHEEQEPPTSPMIG